MKLLKNANRSFWIAFHVLAYPVLGACLLAGAIALVPAAIRPSTVIGWIALSPIIYAGWLAGFLLVAAAAMQILLYYGWKKPRRLESNPNEPDNGNGMLVYGIMMRVLMTWSLPCVRYLLRVPALGRLIPLAYSSEIHVGKNSQIWGMVYDPDLTFVGDSAVIGGDSTLSSHAVTTKPDGSFVYTSAAIHIGDRALVGANARVALGVTIGADAIVLPGSEVLPYTQIPSGEVWGGNPAVFVRHRTDLAPAAHSDLNLSIANNGPTIVADIKPASDDARVLQIRQLVAGVLEMPVEQVGSAFCVEDCSGWDSLAQMAIAAAIHNRFGLSVDANQVFKLRSVDSICRYVDGGGLSGAGVQPAEVVESLPQNPELIPLLKTCTATRLMAGSSGASREIHGNVRVVIAATFTAQQVAPALATWSQAFGIKSEVEFLGYNQVHESLLDTSGLLRTNQGLNAVLLRTEDLLGGDFALAIERADGLLHAIENCAQQSRGRMVVTTLPPVVSDCFEFEYALAAKLRAHWNARVYALPQVDVLDLSRIIENIGAEAAGAQAMALKTRSPYSLELYQELGRELCRIVRKRVRPTAKVLALDADNTLWGGVVAEDGPGGIEIGADGPGRAFQMFQEAILKLRERGVLLALVSKNNAEDVWKVFDHHPEMKIERAHITASRINWQPKSQNLKELARELNVGLDSFVFLDDDAANRVEVAANAPGVTVVPMPSDPADYCRVLTQLWLFDSSTGVTAEDRERAAMMKQEQERKQLLESQSDLHDYLHTLNLRVEMRPATPYDLPRVAQLEQKTNQFNLTLRRRSLDELKTLSMRHTIYVVSASDRFGDYGLIGCCTIIPEEDNSRSFALETLILSCRALGRGVEEALLHGILQKVRERQGTQLVADYVPGPRNILAREFLCRAGFHENGNRFQISASEGTQMPAHVEWVMQETRQAG